MNKDKATIRTLYWCVGLLSFGLVFALYIIILQDDVISQKIYDLNVSQTAFKIQSAQIAEGLCLLKLEMR